MSGDRHDNPTDTAFKLGLAGNEGKSRAERSGFFAIGICTPRIPANMGTLWRSAQAMGAAYTFQIGGRYVREATDTTKAARHVPHFVYPTPQAFIDALPVGSAMVAVELTASAEPLHTFSHPTSAVYVLGSETDGVHPDVMDACDTVTILPGRYCLNVSVAGSIVMYDRFAKSASVSPLGVN